MSAPSFAYSRVRIAAESKNIIWQKTPEHPELQDIMSIYEILEKTPGQVD